MQLRCQVCGVSQPVTTADEADEDPRTQAVRRGFRAEHQATCGERSVSLILHVSAAGEPIDQEAWTKYIASLGAVPPDVRLRTDGLFERDIVRDGKPFSVRVCEDCWANIPRYVDFPFGLTSPESDGAGGAVPKLRPMTVETENPERALTLEHVRKAVCLPCYLAAFNRVYPDAPLPFLNTAVVGDGAPISEPPPPDPTTLGRVTISTPKTLEAA